MGKGDGEFPLERGGVQIMRLSPAIAMALRLFYENEVNVCNEIATT